MSEGPPFKKGKDRVITSEELSGMSVDLTEKTEGLVEWTETVNSEDVLDEEAPKEDARNAMKLKGVSSEEHQLLDNLANLETEAGVIDLKQEAEEQQVEIEKKKEIFLTKLTEEIDEMLQKGELTDEVAESKLASADLIEKGLAETEEGLLWQAKMFARIDFLSEAAMVDLLNENPERPKKPEQEESTEPLTLDVESAPVEEQLNNESLPPTFKETFDKLLPESERDTSMVEDFEAGVAAAETIDELIAVVETVDNIEGTLGFYSSKQLAELICMVARGEQTPLVITRNAGIRKKVLELLAERAELETSPITPPPLPEQAESIHTPEEQQNFERLQNEFFEKQHAYFDAFKNHIEQTKAKGILAKLKSKFTSTEQQQTPEELYAESAILYKDAFKKYTPELLTRRVREAYAELAGKVCFSDLPVKVQKVVNQMAIDGGGKGYDVTSSVPENVITQVQKAGMISESEITELRSKTEHPQVEQKLRLSIWNSTHVAERDALVEIAVEAFPEKDLAIIKKSMRALTGKTRTVVSGLFQAGKLTQTF